MKKKNDFIPINFSTATLSKSKVFENVYQNVLIVSYIGNGPNHDNKTFDDVTKYVFFFF